MRSAKRQSGLPLLVLCFFGLRTTFTGQWWNARPSPPKKPGWQWWDLNPPGPVDCIESRILDAYTGQMTNSKIDLLKTWEDYSALLPVRETRRGNLPLYKLPFFTEKNELDLQVQRLEEGGGRGRQSVAYIAAPSTSGKSAVALLLYLRSLELRGPDHFTHYIYVPFNNNGGKNHGYMDKRMWWFSKKRKEEAGAEFILHCFRQQMKGQYHDGKWSPPGWFKRRKLADIREDFCKEVMAFTKGANANARTRLLFHVDEHGYMAEEHADFRRGALSVGGECMEAVVVLATYTAAPIMPATGSSAVCRYAVPMVYFNARSAFPEVQAALGQFPKLNAKERRLLATLWLRPFSMAAHTVVDSTAWKTCICKVPCLRWSGMWLTLCLLQNQLRRSSARP